MKILAPPQSGSVAGQTASRNRGGQYMRSRAIPVNPQSSRQTLVRSNFGTASISWSDLTNAQRQGWEDYAANHPVQDSLGQTIMLTGHQQYVGSNSALLSAGPSAVVVAPLDPGPTAPVSGTFAVTAPNTASIVFTPTPITSEEVMTVEVSPPSSAAKMFQGDFRWIRTASTAAVSPYTFGVELGAKYGTLPVGAKLFCRLRIVRRDGAVSPYSQIQTCLIA